MPVKDALPYLVECLDSILNQTYQNWELLAINDDSEDKSLEILKEYSLLDSRIKVLQNKGSGIIEALQTAYSDSSGEYITRMDADDIMPSNKLQLMHNQLLLDDENVLVTGYVEYFAEDGVGPGFKRYQDWLNNLVDNKSHHLEMYKECVIPSPCWMTTRSTLDKVGAFSNNVYPEDYDLVFRFYDHGVNFLPIPELLHLWRDHSKRTSRTHKNYTVNTFLKLKTDYFLKLDYDSGKELVVWGAGKKGKELARLLVKKDISFEWVCNNPNKIGVTLYGKTWKDSDSWFDKNKQYQSICVVSKPEDQMGIKNKINTHGNIEEYWFC